MSSSMSPYEGPNPAEVEVNVPLFDALWDLEPKIRVKFGREPEEDEDDYEALSLVGIGFFRKNQLRHGGYYCTPKNTLSFAVTGGDGVHFSFLVRNARIEADSPIIMTMPANSGDENQLIAQNFESFLRLGLRCGWFSLEQFAYDLEGTVQYYRTDGIDESAPADDKPADIDRQVRDFIAESLRLEPLHYSVDDYQRLQSRLSAMLEEN